MSEKLAKIAVALLYMATIIVVLKEFSGHGHHEPDKHGERKPDAISSRLVAGAKDVVLKAKGFSAAFRAKRRLKAQRPWFSAVFLAAFIDSGNHEHPVDHKQIKPRRRGRSLLWKESCIRHVLLDKIRQLPPPGSAVGHRFCLMRFGEATVIAS